MSRDPIEAATSLGYKHIATGGVSGAYWAMNLVTT
jgi:hypothetical protein